MRPLDEITAELVSAHRRQDWETAKALSQEKQDARKVQRNGRRYCLTCGIPISKSNTGGKCHIHRNQYNSWKSNAIRKLLAPKFAPKRGRAMLRWPRKRGMLPKRTWARTWAGDKGLLVLLFMRHIQTCGFTKP